MKPPEPWYADAAVVAFRLPENDQSMAELQPKVTSSGGNFDLAKLTDGDYANGTLLPPARSRRKVVDSIRVPEAGHGLRHVDVPRRPQPRNDDDGRRRVRARIWKRATTANSSVRSASFPDAACQSPLLIMRSARARFRSLRRPRSSSASPFFAKPMGLRRAGRNQYLGTRPAHRRMGQPRRRQGGLLNRPRHLRDGDACCWRRRRGAQRRRHRSHVADAAGRNPELESPGRQMGCSASRLFARRDSSTAGLLPRRPASKWTSSASRS